MNSITNFNTLDNNTLSYTLILCSVTIVGFSYYYFTNTIFNSKVTGNLPNLNNKEEVIENIANNLKNQTITGSDTLVPKLVEASSYKVNTWVQTNETSLNKIDTSVQTGSGFLNRTDIDVTRYTDQGLFIPWDGNLKDSMQELLYGMASDTQSITDISPTEFANHIRNNQEYTRYLDKMQNWVDSVPPHVASSNGRYSSELNFIMDVRKALDTNPSSPIVDLINQSDPNSLIDNNYELLLNNLYTKLNIQEHLLFSLEQIRANLDCYGIILNNSNFNEVLQILIDGGCVG